MSYAIPHSSKCTSHTISYIFPPARNIIVAKKNRTRSEESIYLNYIHEMPDGTNTTHLLKKTGHAFTNDVTRHYPEHHHTILFLSFISETDPPVTGPAVGIISPSKTSTVFTLPLSSASSSNIDVHSGHLNALIGMSLVHQVQGLVLGVGFRRNAAVYAKLRGRTTKD